MDLFKICIYCSLRKRAAMYFMCGGLERTSWERQTWPRELYVRVTPAARCWRHLKVILYQRSHFVTPCVPPRTLSSDLVPEGYRDKHCSRKLRGA